ncbi:hypothetical protein KM043_007042 [Ampulex compressa]|nr:hypothetical protein KM043_007042 [Ampulex compressa]
MRRRSGRTEKEERERTREERKGRKGVEKEGKSEPMAIDRTVGLFMGVPIRTICSKRLVILNGYKLLDELPSRVVDGGLGPPLSTPARRHAALTIAPANDDGGVVVDGTKLAVLALARVAIRPHVGV